MRELLGQIYSPGELIQDSSFLRLLVESQPAERILRLHKQVFSADAGSVERAVIDIVKKRGRARGLVAEAFGLSGEEPDELEPAALEVAEIAGGYSLFPHQRDVVQKLRVFLPGKIGRNRVMVHMPTGSGKTRTSMRLICEYLQANDEASVLWIANTSELCSQAADEFLKAWSYLGNHASMRKPVASKRCTASAFNPKE